MLQQYNPIHSGVAQQDSGDGKSSQWAGLGAMHLVVHFVWIERWSEVQIRWLMDSNWQFV